jgi:large subunit ribosomal protein L25
MHPEVDFFPRPAKTKGETKKLRREGFIPCVVYSMGKPGLNIACKKVSIDTVLRELEFGFLPTTVFSLKDEKGKKIKAIVKDIQYEVTSYDVLHIDFLELNDAEKIEVKVPVRCLGVTDCAGCKAGGFLRQVLRHVPVRCLPKDIPSFFEIDVKDLEIWHKKRIQDLVMPKNVTPLLELTEVVATVIK